ncbi:protein FAM3B [Hyperolius riggenbachi]|uniref:protein FAM3B n=1 Tax=Hyperolius riggenbachi TaxID=752182 RepID=UPI0035A2E741
MVNYRFLSSNSAKAIGLILASLGAWYMGYFFAEILPEDSLQTAIGSVQQLGAKPVIKAPLPKRQKCAAWINCSPNELVFRIRSGGGKDVKPEICLEDEMLSEAAKKAFEELGSKEIRNVRFRSQFVFLAVKGTKIPDGIEKEKIIHSDNARNRYTGWPSEIQIDGCLPKKR